MGHTIQFVNSFLLKREVSLDKFSTKIIYVANSFTSLLKEIRVDTLGSTYTILTACRPLFNTE